MSDDDLLWKFLLKDLCILTCSDVLESIFSNILRYPANLADEFRTSDFLQDKDDKTIILFNDKVYSLSDVSLVVSITKENRALASVITKFIEGLTKLPTTMRLSFE